MFMPSRGIGQGREYHAIRGDAPSDRAVHVERGLEDLADVNPLFALGVSHPDIRIATEETTEGCTVRLHDGVSSWATAVIDQAGTTAVYEGGPRRLLAEVDVGRRHWEERGLPGLWDFGMTITPEGQCVWSGAADSGSYVP
ncbi:hypothetical protein ACFXD5_23590 [Streptomyces sp. NPDC059385]|uniref:hypothetical protein n=1 Tax=Streptomyces sp. NPDC059385 TaxID=3346817 RepID=UPI0036970A6C